MGIFDRIREGLKKTRDAVVDQTVAVFQPGHKLTEEDYETLETALLRADVGPAATDRVLEGVRTRLGNRSAEKPVEAVRAEIEAVLNGASGGAAGPKGGGASSSAGGASAAFKPDAKAPHVTLVVGVNGTGKTTTIAKLAHRYKSAGDRV